jgi:hypothetical protein
MIEFSDAFERLTSHGWLTKEEGYLLWSSALRCEGNVAEFGTYQGRSAMLLAQLLVPRKRTLYCVDPWDDNFNTEVLGKTSFERFMDNLDGLADLPGLQDLWNYVAFFEGRVEGWSPRPCGLVYCDGDHTYEGTVAQVSKAAQCLPQMIAVHDVSDSGGGKAVKSAAFGLLGNPTWMTGTMAVWDRRA